MADIKDNPFVPRPRSPTEIAKEANETSLYLLKARFHQTSATLVRIEQVMPGSATAAHWQKQVASAERDFLDFALQIGLSEDDARRHLLTG